MHERTVTIYRLHF